MRSFVRPHVADQVKALKDSRGALLNFDQHGLDSASRAIRLLCVIATCGRSRRVVAVGGPACRPSSAEYDQHERRELLKAARRHVVPGTQGALISAREARRCCLEGRAEEALEAWRDAVHDAIHAGLSDDAASWLYAIRSLKPVRAVDHKPR